HTPGNGFFFAVSTRSPHSIRNKYNKHKDMLPAQKQFGQLSYNLENWPGREERFVNRAHSDPYEEWNEGRYTSAAVFQKRTIGGLVGKDKRIKTLLEFGCGTTRFTRWWKEIGIEASGGDISPLMLGQGVQLFDGDLVLADSHFMPFKDHTFDAMAFI